jgi:hypothetical protein
MLRNRIAWTGGSTLLVSVVVFAALRALSPSGDTLAEPVADVSNLQQTVIADGNVTDDEYVRAVDATLQCLRENGFTSVHEPRWDATGKVLKWSFSFPPERATEARDTQDKCEMLHLAGVEYYRMLARLPDDEQVAVARATLLTCLEGKGVAKFGPEHLADFELRAEEIRATARSADFAGWIACLEQATRESGVTGYAGW